MGEYFTRDYLRRIRNEIPVPSLLKRLGWPNKYREGDFFFLCPHSCCGEFPVKKTPEANLRTPDLLSEISRFWVIFRGSRTEEICRFLGNLR